MTDFQSSASGLWPCPSGTFENSQQHARVIYGWVHSRQPTQSPEGTAEILSYLGRRKYRNSGRKPALNEVLDYEFCPIRVRPCPSVVKNPILRNEPNFLRKFISINKICTWKIFSSKLFKPIHGPPVYHVGYASSLPAKERKVDVPKCR